MAQEVVTQKGLYFEEFVEGLEIATRGRTITEADIVGFAGLSSDFNPMHTDAVFASKTPFGKRVAHGLLALSIASGMAYQTGIMEGTIIAFRSLEWKFVAPIFIGDTIYTTLKVKERKEMKVAGGGMVTLEVRVLNQDGTVTQKGEWSVLVVSRPAAG